MINIGIIGATGYTGIELLRLLKQHPKVTVTRVTTESYAGKKIDTVYPHLKNHADLTGEILNIDDLIAHCDVIFISLPHGHAAKIVQPLLAAGKKVIDIGADFRLKNAQDYQQWYQHPAAEAALLKQAVYGLPETGIKETLAKATLIANPGCYPTASILATLPALKAGIIDTNSCVYDAKSGVSGAGRTLSLRNHFCEITENVVPYQAAGAHRHTPEIEQALSAIAGHTLTVQFTPHLVPLIRGLLVTAYFKLTSPLSQQDVMTLYQNTYAHEPFIRITDHLPEVKHVRGTNYCDIGCQVDTRTQGLIVVSAIDNLIKGAVGQAIQNMNLMLHFPETLGLDHLCAQYP